MARPLVGAISSTIRLLLVVFGFTAISALVIAYAFRIALTRDQWAAWIQAIGSIGAILASVGLVLYQRNNEREADAEVSRANTRRKLFALKAIVLDAAKTCELAATMVTMDSCQLWQLNRDYLEDARARIAALPLFELSDSGLVSRICAIVFGLQGAISVADRISVRKSDDPKVTAEIFRTTYEICIETAVEITELLKTCSSADDFRRDSESLHRLAKNTKIAQEVIESLRTKPDETR